MTSETDRPLPVLTVRRMLPEERDAVRAMFRRSFAAVKRWFFSWTPDVLVAERGGQLVGAVLLETYPLGGGRRGGFVTWVFTAPEARGTGAAQELIDAALGLFADYGCAEVTTYVEGHNTASSRLFATRDFSILSTGQQLRRYGTRLPALWWQWRHLADIGHFVWARPAPVGGDHPAVQWWGTVLVNALVGFFALWRAAGGGGFDPLAFAAVPLLCLLFFAVRWLTMRWAASTQGLAVRFRAWETGVLLSVLIAAVFGFFFPVPGGAYPVDERWRYRDALPRLGPMALAGAGSMVVLTATAWGLERWGRVPEAVVPWLGYAQMVGAPLALFDTAMVFFPFFCFNGRHVRDWNRPVWVLLALVGVTVAVAAAYF